MKLFFALLVTVLVSGCASEQKSTSIAKEKSEVKPTTASNVTMSKEYKAAMNKKELSCTRTPDVRKVEIEEQSPKGCEVWYSSYGNRNKVAWSANGTSHCQGVQKKIQTNLEQAGYKCSEQSRLTAAEKK